LLVPVASKIHSPADLSGKKVAVLPGTITEGALRSILTRRAIDATVVLVKDHKDGFAAITDGRAHACASDPILISLAVKATNPRLFRLAGTIFSYEPYALMVRRNDADCRISCWLPSHDSSSTDVPDTAPQDARAEKTG
jgi:glutamate/aspartate transport system substrate-binding protein